jgi:hypothetical protein
MLKKGKLSTGKDTNKNLESRNSTLEKEVSKWKAIEKELQVFLDSFVVSPPFFLFFLFTLHRHSLPI